MALPAVRHRAKMRSSGWRPTINTAHLAVASLPGLVSSVPPFRRGSGRRGRCRIPSSGRVCRSVPPRSPRSTEKSSGSTSSSSSHLATTPAGRRARGRPCCQTFTSRSSTTRSCFRCAPLAAPGVCQIFFAFLSHVGLPTVPAAWIRYFEKLRDEAAQLASPRRRRRSGGNRRHPPAWCPGRVLLLPLFLPLEYFQRSYSPVLADSRTGGGFLLFDGLHTSEQRRRSDFRRGWGLAAAICCRRVAREQARRVRAGCRADGWVVGLDCSIGQADALRDRMRRSVSAVS